MVSASILVYRRSQSRQKKLKQQVEELGSYPRHSMFPLIFLFPHSAVDIFVSSQKNALVLSLKKVVPSTTHPFSNRSMR